MQFRFLTNAWQTTWGEYAGNYPIIVGEWGEHEGVKPECQTNAAQLVPAFLSYVSSLHIGLIAWALTPGAMIDGNSLTNPNTFTSTPYSCTSNPTKCEGAGADILQFFANKGAAGD